MKRRITWLAWVVIIGVLTIPIVMWPVGIAYMCKGEHPVPGNIFEAITAIVAMIAIVVAIRQIGSLQYATKGWSPPLTFTRIISPLRSSTLTRAAATGRARRAQIPKNIDAFVTYLLFAAEEILNLFPDDQAWRYALKLDLAHHREFFRSQNYWDDANSYSEALQRPFVAEVLKGEMKGNP